MQFKRSNKDKRPCGSVVEHSLGKGEVAGPIPAMGTINAVLVANDIDS